MSILDIKGIECVYADFDLDSVYEEPTEMIETLKIDTSKTKVLGNKLFLTSICGKEFEFVKKECEERWNRARGHLINYGSDDEVPARCNISLF